MNNTPVSKKTLKEWLVEVRETYRDVNLFYFLDYPSDIVAVSNVKEGLYYYEMDVVVKVVIDEDSRYFKYRKLVTDSSIEFLKEFEDCDWEIPDIDSIVEVFPVQEMTTVYK